MTSLRERAALALVLAVSVCCIGGAFTAGADDAPTVLMNARIIDGNGGVPLEDGVIVIRGATIERVGGADEVALPEGAHLIDVAGETVMPGLADMHVHFMGGWDGDQPDLLGFRGYLNAYLHAGVTTIMDMGNVEPYILQIKQEVNAGRLLGPTIYCVGPLIDGADAQWPAFSVSVSSNTQIPRLVENLKGKGVDFLKAYKGLSFRNLDALVDEAKTRSLGVIVDMGPLNGTFQLSQLGIAAYAHTPGTHEVAAETLASMMSRGIKCITTLSVLENYSHRRLSELSFMDSPLIKDTTPPWFLEELRKYGRRQLTEEDVAKISYFSRVLDRAMANLKRMHDAGIELVAGTDAPYPGVFQGEGIHRELELIVDSGLTPLQAITLATRNAARLVGRQDEWGTLEAGKLANLLIVNGRPDEEISHTRRIEHVFFQGRLLDRDALKLDPDDPRAFRATGGVESD